MWRLPVAVPGGDHRDQREAFDAGAAGET
jgi:hypothetical protein